MPPEREVASSNLAGRANLFKVKLRSQRKGVGVWPFVAWLTGLGVAGLAADRAWCDDPCVSLVDGRCLDLAVFAYADLAEEGLVEESLAEAVCGEVGF